MRRRPLSLAAATLCAAAGVLGAAPAAHANSLEMIPQQGPRIGGPMLYPPIVEPRPGGLDVVLPPGSADLLGINCYLCRTTIGPVTFIMPTQDIWND